MRACFDDTNGRSNGGLHPAQIIIVLFFASVFYGGVFAAFLFRYHSTVLRSVFVLLPSRSGGLRHDKGVIIWVYEFYQQEKEATYRGGFLLGDSTL
jgi:hypothetical protein